MSENTVSSISEKKIVLTYKYYITVLVSVLGGSAQFYSYGVINPTHELITQWINHTYAERSELYLDEKKLNFFWSAVVSSSMLGALVGALFVRFLSENYGRRNALIINGISTCIGASMQLFARIFWSPELLIFGRLMLGMSIGLTSGVVPMYLMELTPAKFRGAAGTLHMVAVAFSEWFSLFIALPEILGNDDGWPMAFALPGLPALLLCVVLPFCPESPRFLLMNSADQEAALQAIKGVVNKEVASFIFDSLIAETATTGHKGTFKQLFSLKELRLPLAVSLLVMVAQQFTGCAAVFAYSTDMFMNAKISDQTARFATLGIGVAYFLFTCLAPCLIDKVGRRPLLLFQLVACAICLTLLATFTGIQEFGQKSDFASVGTIAALVLYMCAYGVGSPIPWMITGELFNQKFRATAVTVSVFLAYFLAFVSSSFYLPLKILVGSTLSFAPFILVNAGLIFVLYFILPETKNRSIGAILSDVSTRTRSFGSAMFPLPEVFSDENLCSATSSSSTS